MTFERSLRAHARRGCAAGVAVAVLLLSGLGLAPASQAAGGRAGVAAGIAIPPAIKARGYLRIGTNPPYYPMEDYQPGTTTCCRGLDIDLGNAIAARLGLKTRYIAISDFGALIAGVNSGNYDMILSSVTINPGRAKNMHFIKYLSVGEGIAVAKGNPHHITDVASLSGLRVALQSGTVESDDVKAMNKTLTARHKSLIKGHTFTSDADAVTALLTGQVDAKFDDFPIVAYDVVRTQGRLQLAGPQFNAAPYGMAIPLKQDALYAAVKSAFAGLQRDGTYLKLVAHYGLQSALVK